MSGKFRHRGVVEGFYGQPWAHEDRLWLIERLGRWGMNRYLYAPKEDPLHRSRWREPYPDAELALFRELVSTGAEHGVDVGFAISPGLSIEYTSKDDRRDLLAKFESFRDLGARFFSLALDDVPSELAHEADRDEFDSLADAHVDLAREVHELLAPDAWLWLVPTDYLGVGRTDYLEQLGAGLPASVEIAWTGRTVLSPTIEQPEAEERAAVLRRAPLIWDNVPVADGPMRSMLHLGPYVGRDPRLDQHVSGVMLNPMQHARASAVALHTAAAYLRDPMSYKPEQAWRLAIEEIGQGDPDAFRGFALAHRFSALLPEDRDPPLEECFSRLSQHLGAGEDLTPVVEELHGLIRDRLAAADRIRDGLEDRRLVLEIEPWLTTHERETRRLVSAFETLVSLLKPTSRSEKTTALMRFESKLAAEPETGQTSYGPRRVFYPQLSSMRSDEMGLGDEPALVRGRSLVDEIVEFVEDLAIWMLSETD